MRVKRLILARAIALATLGTALFAPALPVYACSGPPATLEDLLAAADVLVYAHLVESDAARQTHVIQVETYVVGEAGPEFLLVSQNYPAQLQGQYDGTLGGGDCTAVYRTPPTDGAFYMFLRRTLVGDYHVVFGLGNAHAYAFDTPGADLRVWLAAGDDSYDFVEVVPTEDEFLALLAEHATVNPQPPLPDQPRPRLHPLLLTTEAGTRYLLPVDGGPPAALDHETLMQMWVGWPGHYLLFRNTEACHTFEPPACDLELVNGRFVRQIVNGVPDAIVSPYAVPLVPGDDALYAPGSAAVAIWAGDQLAVYAPHNRSAYAYTDDSPIPLMEPVTLAAGAAAGGADQAAWSQDGRLLAFADGAGLWLWDMAAPEESPRRVLAPEGTAALSPLHFSPGGRYLAYRDGTAARTLDLWTGGTFEYLVFSPGDHYALTGASTPDAPALALRRLAPPGTWEVLDDDQAVVDVAWLDTARFAVVMADDAGSFSVSLYDVYRIRDLYAYLQPTVIPGDRIAVSAAGDLAVRVNGSTISVNQVEMALDLDSPLAGMLWLPTLFRE